MEKVIKNPLISVVMSVYNGEKYLSEAIESILKQTYKDFEFIIVNDGSTDSSLEIIREYQKQDNRIKIIDQENTGLAKALNNGIKITQGKYIARMDADDISLPERLEIQVQFLNENKTIGLVGLSAIAIDEKGEDICLLKRPLSDCDIKEMLKETSPFFHGSVMFHKDLFDSVGSYPEELSIFFEDWVLFRKMGKITNFANLAEPLYMFRITPTAINNRTKRELEIIKDIVNRYLDTNQLSNKDRLLLESLKNNFKGQNNYKKKANYYSQCGVLLIESGKDYSKANRLLIKSILLFPGNLKTWINLLYSFLPKNIVLWIKKNRKIKKYGKINI